MKVKGILNNYQLGSYAYKVLELKIIHKRRIDSYHTEIIWDVDEANYNILKKLVKNIHLKVSD